MFCKSYIDLAHSFEHLQVNVSNVDVCEKEKIEENVTILTFVFIFSGHFWFYPFIATGTCGIANWRYFWVIITRRAICICFLGWRRWPFRWLIPVLWSGKIQRWKPNYIDICSGKMLYIQCHWLRAHVNDFQTYGFEIDENQNAHEIL